MGFKLTLNKSNISQFKSTCYPLSGSLSGSPQLQRMDQNQLKSVSDDPIQREIEKLDETNKKQEWRIQNLEAKAVQNINLYFVFQAVILASSSAANYRNWWIPATLSVLAATHNLFTFCAAMYKVVKSREELDQNMVDLAFMKVYQMTKAQINQVLPGTPLNHRRGEIVRPMPSSARRWRRRLLLCFSVGLFIGFSSVVMYGCHTLLRHPGDRKCVNGC
ncbi:unnamed protein product [Fraxinus pennsylvanica]|uniref:Transmembrane protein n=1 Tax=Fraxinus pennsylvanica TaxID=56036 RepID=A0AAD1Z0R8_9LAMI|nr:unnamed protein product [Fraxinus pennsylvanica]